MSMIMDFGMDISLVKKERNTYRIGSTFFVLLVLAVASAAQNSPILAFVTDTFTVTTDGLVRKSDYRDTPLNWREFE